MSTENIHPEFARMLGAESKEALLEQKGLVLWMYGLSGSGKSTIANAIERRLHQEGRLTKILDGDNIRSGLNQDLGFSDEDRQENIRRIAEVAKLFAENGTLTLTSFICPTRELRQLARDIIGAERFHEIYIACDYETCAQRDVKGLYAKAASGKLSQFTGKDSQFQEPSAQTPAELTLDTRTENLEACVETLYQYLLPQTQD